MVDDILKRKEILQELDNLKAREKELHRLLVHPHEWGENVFTPVEESSPYSQLYTSTKRMWTRRCKICGKVETTDKTRWVRDYDRTTGLGTDHEEPTY